MSTQVLQKKIRKLVEERKAVLLAHNYQVPEIQEIADYIGDSLELAKKAAETDAEVILFCGVDFMAETASILNPDKRVLFPNPSACCPMAAMLPLNKLLEAKKEHPGIPVVLYINTLAEAKAEADICCTSANAVNIVKGLDAEKVLFGPDVNLAYYVGKRIPNIVIIPVPEKGFCNTHRLFGDSNEAKKLKSLYPSAELISHPECKPGFQDNADQVLSTGGMYRYCKSSEKNEFIIATEIGMVQRLRREISGKVFYAANESLECPTMKRITLDNTYKAIRDMKPIVRVDEPLRSRAFMPIRRMLESSR